MPTKYEEQMYNDIHRITNYLEKIAKSLEVMANRNYGVTYQSTPIITSNLCEGCSIYEEIKKGKTVVNDACTFCNKNPFKITCGAKQ